MEAALQGSLGRDHSLAHVVSGRGVRWGDWSRTCRSCPCACLLGRVTTAGALHSPRVIRREARHYYGPLGRPRCRARPRRWLIRAALPRPDGTDGPLCAARLPVTCCAGSPTETIHASPPDQDADQHGLPREMSGSALTLQLCRLQASRHIGAGGLASSVDVPDTQLGPPTSQSVLGLLLGVPGPTEGGTRTRWRRTA